MAEVANRDDDDLQVTKVGGHLEYVVIGLLQIAAADGVIDGTERLVIHEVCQIFGFSDTEIHRLFLIFDESIRREDERETPKQGSVDSIRIRHLEILGLRGNVTFVEIKTAYRELARRHHPDLLRAQGVPVEHIKDAEEVLKTINVAYEWLYRHNQDSKSAMT